MRIRSQRWMRLAAATALGIAFGCADKIAPVHLTDLLGTWQLIHLHRTSAATGETTDALAADDGSSMTMTVLADSTVTTVTIVSGGAPVNGTGTIAVSRNLGRLTLDGQDFFCNFFLKDGVLTIDCGPQLGLEEFSRITFIFQRP